MLPSIHANCKVTRLSSSWDIYMNFAVGCTLVGCRFVVSRLIGKDRPGYNMFCSVRLKTWINKIYVNILKTGESSDFSQMSGSMRDTCYYNTHIIMTAWNILKCSVSTHVKYMWIHVHLLNWGPETSGKGNGGLQNWLQRSRRRPTLSLNGFKSWSCHPCPTDNFKGTWSCSTKSCMGLWRSTKASRSLLQKYAQEVMIINWASQEPPHCQGTSSSQ